jgi:uncharacterized protein (DUF58 family)
MLMPKYEELVALRKQTPAQNGTTNSKVTSLTGGNHRSLFKGRGLDFSDCREYVPGDDIRSIDWRVTARKERPHTKIFIEERERSVYVVVDINTYMQFGTRNTFKSVQAARVASLLAWMSNHLKDKTGAILFGSHPEGVKFLPARSSRKSIWEMLKILCTPYPLSKDVKIEQALEVARQRVPSGSNLFVISDFFDPSTEFESALGALANRCDVTLVKINDPADKKIPSVHRIQFSNERGTQAEVDTSDSLGAQKYQQCWERSDDRLKAIANKFRTRILNVMTSGDAQSELLQPLNSQKRKRAL